MPETKATNMKTIGNSLWTCEQITSNAAEKFQVGAGLLVENFNPKTPKAPTEGDIVGDTTGDYTITMTPKIENLFADVNNADDDFIEGEWVHGWTGGLTINMLSMTENAIKLGLAKCAGTATDGITPARGLMTKEEAKNITWLGDILGTNQLLCIVLNNTMSSNGIAFTAKNKGKGQLALNLKPHRSTTTPDEEAMKFYILTKTGE